MTSGSKVFGQVNSTLGSRDCSKICPGTSTGVSIVPCPNLRISRNSGNMFKDSMNGKSLMIVTAKPLG